MEHYEQRGAQNLMTMENSKSFLIDVIRIVPEGSDCYVQAPSLDDKETLELMKPSEYSYYKIIKLEGLNKIKFIERLKTGDIGQYMQSMEIKIGQRILFEGWDGIEFGLISKTIILPHWFIDKYKDMYDISKEW